MNIEKIKEITTNLLKKHGLELYSLKTKREFGTSILEVLVIGDFIDAQKLGSINEELNEKIDEYLPASYYLEVSTAGAIRVLSSIEDVKRQIGKYLELTKDGIKIKGVLEKVVDDVLFLKTNEKGRIKVVEASFSNQDEVKLTVKY